MDIAKSIMKGLSEAIEYEQEGDETMWVVAMDMPYYPSVSSFKNYEDAKKEYDYWKNYIKRNMEDDFIENECVFIGKVENWFKTSEYEIGEDEK